MTILVVTTIILAALGAIGVFIPMVPTVILSYAALLCGHFIGAIYIDTKVLIFWGVASAIVLGLRTLQRRLALMTSGNAFVSGGAFVGTVLGYMIAPTASAMILGGIVGSFLGAMAYMRSPGSPRLPIASRGFLDFLCVKGLSATVTLTMSAISLICVL